MRRGKCRFCPLFDFDTQLLNFAGAMRVAVAGMIVAIMISVRVGRFEESDPPGSDGACDEKSSELPAIMGVKLDFGEKIGQGNAEERASGKCQCATDNQCLLALKLFDTQNEE